MTFTSAQHTRLGAEELQRYSRHLLLPEVGMAGQERLRAGRVLLVGAGGLGSPAALYLAAAGVGALGIVDFDVVDRSNLQRQVLHGTKDVGRAKTASARARIADVNPHVAVTTYEVQLTSANALDVLGGWDVVVDGTDNFATRYLVNDACVLLGVPNVYGSIFRFEGQASVFGTADGPCYRCLFPVPPPVGSVPSCAEGGVLGVLPGLVGTIQATEAIKLLLGAGESLAGRLLLIDALAMRFRSVRLRRDPSCPACGTREIRTLIDYDAFCGAPTHSDSRAMTDDAIPEITPAALAARLAAGDRPTLVDVREPHELAISHIEGASLVPLGTLGAVAVTWPRDDEYVLICRTGARSGRAVEAMRRAGFTRVWNLAGGMNRWSEDVDPSQPTY